MSTPNHGLSIFVTFHIQSRRSAADIENQEREEWARMSRGGPVGIAEFQPVTEENHHMGYWLAEKPGEDQISDTVARVLIRRLGEKMEASLEGLVHALSDLAAFQSLERWNLGFGMTRLKDPAWIQEGQVLPLKEKDRDNPPHPLRPVGFFSIRVTDEGLSPSTMDALRGVFEAWVKSANLPSAPLSEQEAGLVHNRRFEYPGLIRALANPSRLQEALDRVHLQKSLPEGVAPKVVRL